MIQSIVIVGGGSAGWMTAAHLAVHLPELDITVIEASDIPTVGFGESTVPPIVDFMRRLGLEESEWMPACGATYKSAIAFHGFHRPDEPKIWFPFESIEIFKGRPLNRYWLYKHFTDAAFADRFSFYDYCHFVPALCEAGRTVAAFPEAKYAYHFDAGRFGDFLKRFAIGGGVTHVVDTIESIERAPDGSIDSLKRRAGEPMSADLFIDCTGLRSLLLGQQLGEPFDDYGDHLYSDRAVALPIAYEDKNREMLSYTMCSAKDSGWIWQIPLYDRMGAGYVYSSRHSTADEAESQLRDHVGRARSDGVAAEHVQFRTGKYRRTWVKNCVAVGLSAGFTEPLESTAIQTVQGALDVLTETLRTGSCAASDVAVFNRSVTQLFEIIRDFLVTHYALTDREDTSYWREVKYETVIPDSLADKLALARAKMPDREILHRFDDAGLAGFYFEDGWQNILVGMNHLPFNYDHLARNGAGPYESHIQANLADADEQYLRIKANKDNLANFPTHYEHLRNTLYGGRP